MLSYNVSAEELTCDVIEPCSGSVELGYCLAEQFPAENGLAIIKVGNVTTLTELMPADTEVSYKKKTTYRKDVFSYRGLMSSGAMFDVSQVESGSNTYQGYILLPYTDDAEVNVLFNVICQDKN